jgi:hypothetical protein
MLRILRDHGPGQSEPRYSLVNGAMSAPCMHAGGLAAASQTTASWVADLSRDHVQHWVTGTAAPCCSLFKPVRVDEPLDLGPAPSDVFDRDSLWWRGELLHRRVMCDPGRLFPLFAPERDDIEHHWLAQPPQPAEAFTQADELLDRWTAAVAAVSTSDHRPSFVRRYWAKRNRRAHVPDNAPSSAETAEAVR